MKFLLEFLVGVQEEPSVKLLDECQVIPGGTPQGISYVTSKFLKIIHHKESPMELPENSTTGFLMELPMKLLNKFPVELPELFLLELLGEFPDTKKIPNRAARGIPEGTNRRLLSETTRGIPSETSEGIH